MGILTEQTLMYLFKNMSLQCDTKSAESTEFSKNMRGHYKVKKMSKKLDGEKR